MLKKHTPCALLTSMFWKDSNKEVASFHLKITAKSAFWAEAR